MAFLIRVSMILGGQTLRFCSKRGKIGPSLFPVGTGLDANRMLSGDDVEGEVRTVAWT